MLDRLFRNSRLLTRLRVGEMGASLDGFVAHLLERGHSHVVAQRYVRVARHFGHWLAKRSEALSSVGEDTVRLFLVQHLTRCRCHVPNRESVARVRAALRHLLALLRREGRIREALTPGEPSDAVLSDFDFYLRGTCGLAPSTCGKYVEHVRCFLRGRFGHGPVDLPKLTPADVLAHVARRGVKRQPGTVEQAATVLRRFLRFLRLRGIWVGPLVDFIPRTPHRKLAHLPKVLTEQQVSALLDVFDRATPLGLRGYAFTLCLVRLGLRAGEVARLCLGDIDWRAGSLRIAAGKGRRERLLPLPAEVGRAIVAYLRKGRPRTAQRRVFVCHRTPIGPMGRGAVYAMVRTAWTRAGVEVPSKGTHVLRHTTATHLLRRGASLKEIADLLGHRSIDTTAIYAKVDLGGLAEVALPWPNARA